MGISIHMGMLQRVMNADRPSHCGATAHKQAVKPETGTLEACGPSALNADTPSHCGATAHGQAVKETYRDLL